MCRTPQYHGGVLLSRRNGLGGLVGACKNFAFVRVGREGGQSIGSPPLIDTVQSAMVGVRTSRKRSQRSVTSRSKK
jgi:hypothetical protein